MSEPDRPFSLQMTAEIVAAYVSSNPVTASEAPDFIHDILDALAKASAGVAETPSAEPVVPVRRSLLPGRREKFKSLKRHLEIRFGKTPEEHRAKRGLPPDYPMVGPSYFEQRAVLTRKHRFDRKR